MNILHIASIDNNKANGMNVAIPKHVMYQSKYENVALLNLKCEDLNQKGIICYNSNQCMGNYFIDLPKPFCNPDLIVIHGIYYPQLMKIYKVIKENRIPYVLVPHGCLSEKSLKRKYLKKKIGLMLIFNKIINNANAIQYLSENERNTSLGRKNNNFIGSNGIEEVIRQKKIVSKERLTLNYIGRISILHKGLDLIVEACNLVKDEMRDRKIFVNIYGDNKEGDKEKLIKLIDLYGIGDILKIKEPVFDYKKSMILQETDIFIQPSRWEGQPMGIMEAMAYGIPIIATKGTNMSEEIKNNKCGWEVDGTAEAIGKCIIEVSEMRKSIDEYGKNAKKYIVENFNWDKVSSEIINKYYQVVEKNNTNIMKNILNKI